MTQDIHHQLPRLPIRNPQLIPPILQPPPLLPRMPSLIRHPARALGGEHQHGHLVGLAAEDAVGAGVVLIQLRLGNIQRGVRQHRGAADAVDGEAAQRVLVVVPGIQVPA